MGKNTDTTITSCCMLKGASTTLSFEPSEIIEELKGMLGKRLLKNGTALRLLDESGTPEVLVRVAKIDQGNRFLRYFLPFPWLAVLEVEGQIAVPGSAPRPFHYVQKAQMGLFGGSARGMLKVGADRLAGKIAGDVPKPIHR